MLDNLINLIRQNAGSAVIDNPAIPNEHNDAVISEAGNSIMNGLKNMIAQGNLQDVISLFNHNNGNITDTPAAQQLSGSFMQNLVSKFGLDQNAAGGVANNLIPQVLQKFVHKTNDPNDSSFNMEDILSHLSGGQSGDFDLQGLAGGFTQNSAGAGLMDTVKGLFGN